MLEFMTKMVTVSSGKIEMADNLSAQLQAASVYYVMSIHIQDCSEVIKIKIKLFTDK